MIGRRTVLTGIAASLATPAFAADTSLSLVEIMDRHTKARGGAAALDALNSQEVELQIVEKGNVIKAHYRCNKAPFFRIDIYDKGKHVFCEGLDAKGPWIWPGDQSAARQGVPDAKRTGIEGILFNVYGLHAFPKMGNQIALDGRELLGGVNYYVLRVSLKDSYQTFLYIDPQSWMIARRRDFRANHPDINPVKVPLETQYSDFRSVSGVMSAFLQHQVELTSGHITQVTIIDRLAYNPKLDAKIFDRSYKAA